LAATQAFAQSTSGASSSVNISNPASTESRNRLITVPTVVSPGLAAAGMETCLGAASGGLSLMGLGLTFGRTTPDEGCHIRLAARQLHAFGFKKAALALMCQDSRVAEAMAAAGDVCPARFAEMRPRRRQQLAEDITGSIGRPGSADFSSARNRRLSGDVTGSVRQPRGKFKPWKNPDFAAAQSAMQDAVAIGPSLDEERLFARVSLAY
jgi:hypothetical protein